MQNDVVVIGAGVTGLTTSAVLLENGYRVRLWAKELSPDTTSDRAGAIWYPYLSGPADKVVDWCAQSIQRFWELETDVHSGVFPLATTMLFRSQQAAPGWHTLLRDFKNEAAVDLGEYAWKQTFSVPFIDAALYVPYLERLVRDRGGSIERRTVKDFSEALAECRIVMNCSGLGSARLCGDEAIYPVRGQTVRLRKEGVDLSEALIDDEEEASLAYVFPRTNDILCGGTSQPNNADKEPRTADTTAILARCCKLVPALASQEVLGVSVGLRPARPTVRVESERHGEGWVVHNYGHGGSGFTLSWGCAAEAAGLVVQLTD